MVSTSEQIETLAAAIGEEVYIDVAKWHLYLRDAKLHTHLAEQLLPMVTSGTVDEDSVTQVLRQVSVPLGGGRAHLPLFELVPMQGLVAMVDILEKFADDWA